MDRLYSRSGKLIALYSVFNDARLIEESIRSIDQLVDEVRVYDGRYSGYNCTCGQAHDFSCDETKEAVSRIQSETGINIKYVQLQTMYEFDKRQIMFDELKLGDTGFVIDGDEIFYGDRSEILRFTQATELSTLSKKCGRMFLLGLEAGRDKYHRLHVKTNGLKIVPSGKMGYWFEDDEGPYLEPVHVYMFQQARIVHLMSNGIGAGFRPKNRDKARFAYNNNLQKGLIKSA